MTITDIFAREQFDLAVDNELRLGSNQNELAAVLSRSIAAWRLEDAFGAYKRMKEPQSTTFRSLIEALKEFDLRTAANHVKIFEGASLEFASYGIVKKLIETENLSNDEITALLPTTQSVLHSARVSVTRPAERGWGAEAPQELARVAAFIDQ